LAGVRHENYAVCQVDARQITHIDDHGLSGNSLFDGQAVDDFLAGPSPAGRTELRKVRVK